MENVLATPHDLSLVYIAGFVENVVLQGPQPRPMVHEDGSLRQQHSFIFLVGYTIDILSCFGHLVHAPRGQVHKLVAVVPNFVVEIHKPFEMVIDAELG